MAGKICSIFVFLKLMRAHINCAAILFHMIFIYMHLLFRMKILLDFILTQSSCDERQRSDTYFMNIFQ